jgi:hypothetical protein
MDFDKVKYELGQRKSGIIFWVSGFLFMLFIFIFISSKEFSFLIILSSMTQMLGFVMLLWIVYTNRSCSGISYNTIICYMFILTSRLLSTLFYSGYLPSDEAGDWFYQLNEICTLVAIIILSLLISYSFKDTYNAEFDTFYWGYFVVPTLGLALLIHTNLNRNVLTDAAWSFSMYLETVAIYPQIDLFVKKRSQIETFTSHYVALQGLSRLFSLIFWYYTYEELVSASTDHGYSLFPQACGYLVILSQVVQLAIMGDYYYQYFKSAWKGESINLGI